MRDRYENPAWLKTQMRVDEYAIYHWRDSGQVPCKSDRAISAMMSVYTKKTDTTTDTEEAQAGNKTGTTTDTTTPEGSFPQQEEASSFPVSA